MMKNLLLANGVWTLELTEQGHHVGLRSPSVHLHAASAGPVLCEFSYGEPRKRVPVTTAQVVRVTPSQAEFETVIDLGRPVKLRFAYGLSRPDDHGTAVKCTIVILPERPLDTDVHLRWFWDVRLSAARTSLFAPLFDGRGLRTTRIRHQEYHYVCAGGGGGGEKLSIPLVVEGTAESPVRVARFADPFFSTGIRLPSDGNPGEFECTYLSAAGPRQFPERVFGHYLHDGDEEVALEGFFRQAIPGCPPGSDWLHDIAMVHYDYLSEKGQGWFRDIDRLVELVDLKDRGRVVLTLHGWYDLLGRYCFDENKQRLDREWTVMPQGDRSEMTLGEIHRRIAYGKERGFRVFLYYADGMAIDSGAPDYTEDVVFRESDGSPRKHHWAGPDTITQTYIMNPIHPRVQKFFRGYTRALLDEFGEEIDGLTWDETFTTHVGDLSPGAGYADREFMLLCHELRSLIKGHNPHIAFMASDCTGLQLPQEDGSIWTARPAQNALVFDGTYQDSQCYPTAWQYGLFPNYRNVLWSCNWQPTKNFEWTVLGVKAFGAPVAISNGWGESKGISRYSEQETAKILQLFQIKREQRGRVRWIEYRDL
jgi:hypothetical protein